MHRFHALWLAALAAACSSGGSGDGSRNPPPPPQRITVSGTVVDETGRPYAGALVAVPGTGWTRSAADGAFTIADVVAPYDVMVIAESAKTITEVRGVTSAWPVLSFERQDRGPLRTATVQGTVTDAQGVAVRFSDAQIFGQNPYAAVGADGFGAYSLVTEWWGDTPATLNHRAVSVPSDGLIWWATAFSYALRPIDVSDGATVVGQDFVLAPLPAGNVSGEGTGRATNQNTFALVARFDDGIERTLFARQWGDSPLGPFDVLVPALADGDVRLEFSGSFTDGSGSAKASAVVTPGQTGVALALPPPPEATGPLAPSGGGKGVTITWSMTEWTGTDLVTVTCASGHVYRFAGKMRAAGVDDLSGYGVDVPTNTRCDWRPGWASYTVEELVQGPAAIAALPLVRTSLGDGGMFYF